MVIAEDEGVRADTTAETLAKLRPAFAKDGTITAGSSSQISDGACAVVVMSKAKAEELGLTWLAEIGAHGNVAGPDNSLQSQPANAILQALGKEGLSAADLDLIEINEAFAAVGIQSTKELGVTPSRSTSTAARSRWATRSACPAPGSCSPGPGAAPPWRWRRRGRAVRRRRSGRRADRPGAADAERPAQ